MVQAKTRCSSSICIDYTYRSLSCHGFSTHTPCTYMMILVKSFILEALLTVALTADSFTLSLCQLTYSVQKLCLTSSRVFNLPRVK